MSQQQQQQQQQQRCCAVFGVGRIGKVHYANLLALRRCKVKYVIDACPEAAREFLGADSGVRVLTPDEEDRVFADKDVSFCVIASPTFTHEGIISKCVASGKHMFCEKPVAESVEAMMECYRMAQRGGVTLHCSYNRRFDPSFNIVKQKIPEVCGSVYSVRTCSRDSPPPPIEYLRTSGGVYYDSCVHDIDVVCWIVGEWPESVFAVGTVHDPEIRQLGDFDTTVIVLRFPSGAIGTVDMSRFSTFGHDQRLEVHGPQGMLASNNLTDRAVTASTAGGVNSANILYSFTTRYQEAYMESMRVFVTALEGDSSSQRKLVTPLESANVGRIAAAAEQSARTGQPVPFVVTTQL